MQDYAFKTREKSQRIAPKLLKFKRAGKIRAKWSDEEFAAEADRIKQEVANFLAAKAAKTEGSPAPPTN